MTIAYDGGGYKGWQRLTNEPGTIQGTIERVLSKIEGSPVKISGSGRTDAGVHAKGQVAHAFLKTNEDPELLRQELNRMLPEDIRICLVESVSSLSTAGTVQYLRCMNTGSIRDHVQMYLQENTVITDRCILIWIVCAKQPIT